MAMILKTVGPGRGALWVRDGLRLYMRQPMAFTGLFALFLLAALFSTLLPLVGWLLQMMMVPLLSLGFMVASQSVLLGGRARAVHFIEPLLGAPTQRRALLLLCALYGLLVAGSLWLADWAADGGYTHLFQLMSQTPAPLHEIDALFVERSMAAGALVGTTAITLVTIPFWHAPALVHWAHQGALQALFSSTLAVWRCRGAFVVYALAWAGVVLAFGAVAALLFSLLGARQLAGMAAMPAALIFSTVFYVSLLFTYEGCFSDSAAAPAAG